MQSSLYQPKAKHTTPSNEQDDEGVKEMRLMLTERRNCRKRMTRNQQTNHGKTTKHTRNTSTKESREVGLIHI